MSDADDGVNRYERIVRQRIERMEQVLDEVDRQGTHLNVSPGLKRELVSAIVSCHRVLAVLQDESVLDDGDIPDVTPIRSRLNRQTRVRTSSKRRGQSVAYESRPAVDELPINYLIQFSVQLEQAAKKLNFWASGPEQTGHDDFDHGDLADLLDHRGQDDALEKVPGGEP